MLVLSRKTNESIIIDGDITITVLEIRGDTVRLGIACPKEMPIRGVESGTAAHGFASALPWASDSRQVSGSRRIEKMQFVEISLGQLLAQVGAQESDAAVDGGFTSEGGISPSL